VKYMGKAKLIGLIVGVLVVIVAAALLSLRLFVNPNNFKDRIAAAVKQSTGRELKLDGDIKLSVFPWIALELGPATLGNPPGFGDQPFLSFGKAAVRVKLLPLLQKRLEIARVEVDGLDLRLMKNKAGRGNWQSPEDAKPEPEADTHGGAAGIESLSNIRVQHGRVSYQDTVIENFDLETGSVAGGSDVPINLGFDAKTGTPATEATVTAKFNLGLEADGSMRVAAVNVSGTLSRPGDGRPTHWDLSVPVLAVDLDKQTAAASAFSMSYSSAHVNGGINVTQLMSDLHASGSVTLAPLVLHEFAPRLGITLPKTRDPKVLSELSGAFAFSYDAASMALDKLQLKLDDTNLRGDIKVSNGETTAVKFELAVDQIDLDRYRAPDATPATSAPRADAAKPTEKAKLFAADGAFTLGAVHVAGMDLTNLRVLVAAHDGVTHLNPITAALDGGQFTGDVTLDQRSAVATLSLEEHLSGVDLARMLANSGEKGRASGRANVAMKILAHGTSSDLVMKTLDGHVDANITEGALEGVDLAYELGTAQALIDRQSPAPPANTKRTKFDTFKATADIVSGIATTKDLTISSPAFKVLGQGSINLPTKGLNLNMTASILKAPTTTLVDIPLKITGTYADPTVRPDMEALAKGQVKQKLQDVLKKNGLEGLFK
jgi:AsmA protein